MSIDDLVEYFMFLSIHIVCLTMHFSNFLVGSVRRRKWKLAAFHCIKRRLKSQLSGILALCSDEISVPNGRSGRMKRACSPYGNKRQSHNTYTIVGCTLYVYARRWLTVNKSTIAPLTKCPIEPTNFPIEISSRTKKKKR